MAIYNESDYYIDFSSRDDLTDDEKTELETIQSDYRPIERVDALNEYKYMGKITDDEFETMTGTPYVF